ncbi:transglutaminase domain-containing protein [Chitinophaga sp. Cy-1792]|uniref:transglutaminase domain-containing protein n=1 Tax=Chitinophaga sp. Cy-1792 TaxID=2608339 RepID=UPI001423092B|nr:transglutaminase domain-containing protein [Chitinophaga sp. Cy-1792]NIG57093.1 hypothetical protein [Chitinophaga sp. Cy-1792]
MRLFAAIMAAGMFVGTLPVFAQTAKPKAVAKPVITYVTIPDTEVLTTTAMAGWLKTNSKSTTESLKSIYAWVGKNIAYDTHDTYNPQYYKDTADAVAKTLRSRQAICYGYASLFVDIAQKAGIPSIVVTGYTIQDGELSAGGSHAWVAAMDNGQWVLIDPTWAAGGVNSSNMFVPSFNWKYFMVQPAVFLKTHVPYDPMYQFLDHPFRHDEIRDRNWSAAASRPVFAYADSIKAWQQLDYKGRTVSSLDRIRRYGVSNAYVSNELSYLMQVLDVTKHNEEVDITNKEVGKYNWANSKYNRLVVDFNDYINFKNNQFTPAKTDEEIRNWMDSMVKDLAAIQKLVGEIQFTDDHNKQQVEDTKRMVTQMKTRIDEEQAFVTKYLKTGKLFRKSLFYKMRWI